MTGHRINNGVAPLTRANLFNLPSWWIGRPMSLLRLDTIIANLTEARR